MFAPPEAAAIAGRQVRARLDPLLTACGFQAGFAGAGADEVNVIYCIKYPDFRSRFPRLAPEIHSSDPGACTDLNVQVELRDVPRLAEVRLDSDDIGQLLRDVGRNDLVPRAATLVKSSLAGGLDELHDLLLEVFARAAAAATRNEWDRGRDE